MYAPPTLGDVHPERLLRSQQVFNSLFPEFLTGDTVIDNFTPARARHRNIGVDEACRLERLDVRQLYAFGIFSNFAPGNARIQHSAITMPTPKPLA